MNSTLIVFTVGTAVSFLPLYWLALRFSARWIQPSAAAVTARAEPPGRREFLDLLRREAASRAVAVLHEALAEARLTADYGGHGDGGLSAKTRKSLDETGRLVDSLFARELREKFRQGSEALAFASSGTLGSASASCTSAITAFERALSGDGERPPVSRRRAGWLGGLLTKVRALTSVGDARAAA